MLGRIGSKITRNIKAALDPAVPTDREVKNFITKNERNIKFTAEPPPEYGSFDGCDFSFYLRGNTPFYVTVDKERSLVLVQRNWTDGGEKAVIKFADIVG